MKLIYILSTLVSFVITTSCNAQKSLQSSIINVEGTDPRGNLMLLGQSTKQRLQQAPFAEWFNKNYADYQIDSTTAQILKAEIRTLRFVIFMGTWCGDSRLEVPKMYKLLEFCEVLPENIQLINLNIYDSVYKQSPTHEEKGLNIHRVPDLLVYENNVEIGRIVERPVTSWEKDLLAIVRKDKYEPNYRIVHYLNTLIQSVPLNKIENDIVKIADSLKPHISRNEGLMSFGNVLLATNQAQKALIVHRLNTILYPGSANGFVALADAYLKSGDRVKAKENYERAVSIEPGHQKATAMLPQLMN